jgi:hypothetical protein
MPHGGDLADWESEEQDECSGGADVGGQSRVVQAAPELFPALVFGDRRQVCRDVVFPTASRPSFPHFTSNNDRGGSTIAALEHQLKPLKSGVGPHPGDSLPASPRFTLDYI